MERKSTSCGQQRKVLACALLLLAQAGLATPAVAAAPATVRPWMNTDRSADERAHLLERELTQTERLGLLHSPMALNFGPFRRPLEALGSAGFVAGIARLGVPALNQTDAGLGVTNPLGGRPGDTATAFPAGLALASTWNVDLARASGAAIGQEAHAKGFNVLLGGGANLTRDPRGGRNFEYLSEDPWLTGVMAGASIAGIQSAHVISTVKHFALNPYETGRDIHDGVIDAAALRESDLLAIELAIERGQPGAVMCAYNKVNGEYACENSVLLNDTLKRDWGYAGWVMSDWGAVHSTGAAARGLDHESGQQLDAQVYFGEPLKHAVANGTVAPERIADMARRILRSMFAVGLFDHPPVAASVDYAAHARLARSIAAEGIVLLRNVHDMLPLSRKLRRIAVIGGNASIGVLSGGGSSQVTPTGAAPLSIPMGGDGPVAALFRNAVWLPSAPLAAIRARAPTTEVVFDDGRYPAAAADLARSADAVIIFGTQWSVETEDVPDLSLPQGQDALIAAVTAANPRTVVVLETGNPVAMPWLGASAAVLAAWYPGQQGGDAIADVLFGAVNPSGRLPMTFPQSTAQLPRPQLPGFDLPKGRPFSIDYREGADVGYRWYQRTGAAPLFSFGYGLSYTTFALSALKAEAGAELRFSFEVHNTGPIAGAEVPQLYLVAAAGQPLQRLIGWEKVWLQAGERRRITLQADPRLLGHFDVQNNCWRIDTGQYRVALGRSAGDLVTSTTVALAARTIRP